MSRDAPTRVLRRLAVLPIRAYQRLISPWKPPTCRFHPTCSHYAIEAVEVHGVVKGALLSTWRILRCQPFSKPGPDPVPPRGQWRSTPPEDLVPEPEPDADHSPEA